jgi:hypothetical protein
MDGAGAGNALLLRSRIELREPAGARVEVELLTAVP